MNDFIAGTGDMKTPFYNDMFWLVWLAFSNLNPDKKNVICEWVPELEETEGGTVYGRTCLCEDGNYLVQVTAQIPVKDAVEILAHELAHVAAGPELKHGPEWKKAFDDIYEEYVRIGEELYDLHTPVDVIDGKAYVGEGE